MPDFVNENTMMWIFTIFPFFTVILSFIAQLLIKKKGPIVLAVFLFYVLLTFTVFNSSFFMWSIGYAGIALLGTLLADLVLKSKDRFLK